MYPRPLCSLQLELIMNDLFYYIQISEQKVLIISNTWESLDTYLKKVALDLKSKTTKTEVVFDLLLSKGINDRFFSVPFDNGRFSLGAFRKIEKADIGIEAQANKYFANHSHLIDISVLSQFQKSFFKRKLKCIS